MVNINNDPRFVATRYQVAGTNIVLEPMVGDLWCVRLADALLTQDVNDPEGALWFESHGYRMTDEERHRFERRASFTLEDAYTLTLRVLRQRIPVQSKQE